MGVLEQLKKALSYTFETYFSSDGDMMSMEAKKIFSNPDDKKKYIDAIEKLRNTQGQEEKIILSSKEEITLFS